MHRGPGLHYKSDWPSVIITLGHSEKKKILGLKRTRKKNHTDQNSQDRNQLPLKYCIRLLPQSETLEDIDNKVSLVLAYHCHIEHATLKDGQHLLIYI